MDNALGHTRAPLYDREQERLSALRALGKLDSVHSEDFDQIVELVAAICNVPTTLVSLVDEDKQWFRAKCGFTPNETPIEQSICAHAILENDILEIRDCSLDPRTRHNPLVTGKEHVRFYAGAPLRTRDGLPLGTLCVIDTKPRDLTPVMRLTLKTMADQAMRLIDLNVALETEATLRREVDHRVKNSLQSVAALTRLKARESSSEDVKTALSRVETRIRTVAALHEALYKSSATNLVDLADYTNRLRAILSVNAPPNVQLTADMPSVLVHSEQASAVAVILNEFTANSFKYAFPDDQDGQIRITGERKTDGLVHILLEDNGVGADASKREANAGLGLRIIEASTIQLGGTWRILERQDGFAGELAFPVA